MIETKLVVGGSPAEDAAAFVSAWRRAEKGEKVSEQVLAFDSWEGLAWVMTGERYRLLGLSVISCVGGRLNITLSREVCPRQKPNKKMT
ncbi:MAG: hypothetical protein ABI668_00265 [Sphingorhabdus sp.]